MKYAKIFFPLRHQKLGEALARHTSLCHHSQMTNSPPTTAPLTVFSPPDTVPSGPPVSTRVQLLPFEALSWENFERLSCRLIKLDGNFEHCARYGQQGDAQEGIDIFARQADGRYHCLQAKRHRSFGPSKLRDAVGSFLKGSWAERAARFTITIQASLSSTNAQEEIERQAADLEAKGIVFTVLDGEKLTERLREHPILIDDFFGRPWVIALLGKEVADTLGKRLDGTDFACVRSQLARVYRAQFHSFDPGSFGSISDEDGKPALSLIERYKKPDIMVRETVQSPESNKRVDSERFSNSNVGLTNFASYGVNDRGHTVAANHFRRVPLNEWFGESQRFVLLGDAGCGKSTLLRVIALDLLHDQEHFPELASRWGQHIPVYIPFARWTSQIARDGNTVGIKEIIQRSLEPLLTKSIVDLIDCAIDDKRVVVLIDGLDEWGSEQAARTTLNTLVTTIEAHDIPVIVSGRPRGLSRIGALPYNWKRGTIAPLSIAQQAAITSRWFERYASGTSSQTTLSEANLRTNRFMAELAREVNLGALASVPLLLIGLVTLSLRGQILPRTKRDIYDQLVRILLEDHPTNRATASGETEPRFRHATDPNQKRAAISQLAFSARMQTGGAGMPINSARKILRTYLTSPEYYDLAEADAAAVANEILSVNAETQGLLVENAPGEVGFIHASFEEFLSAEHIGGWPFRDIEAFVSAHAGEGRWRNVISNVLDHIQRRDEFDKLVAQIEITDPDEIRRYHRQFLLGDIAFNAVMRSTTTTKRLALSTMSQVESEDWLPARREALASVLKGLGDQTVKADIEQHLARWLPARLSPYNRASLVSALSTWKPTSRLQDLLFQAMYDEDSSVQRAAAAAYAKAFSPSVDACQRLIDGLARTRDIAAAAALLEGLALGWPTEPKAASLFSEAWQSHSAELRLVGILGLAATGAAHDGARDTVLKAQSFWSGLSYSHGGLAAMMLMKYWRGDDKLIESALLRVSRSSNVQTYWEYDVACRYLLESSTDRADVRTWILAQLKSDFPFSSIADGRRNWSHVGRFAVADPKIRAAANAYWCKPRNQLIAIHNLPNYVNQVADSAVAKMLVDVLSEKTKNFNRYWALNALLTGWGRNHPEIKFAIDVLVQLDDEYLFNLAPFLPEIMGDKAAARERLIRMSACNNLRRDLLATGLENCGCDGSDNQAVAAILAFPEQLRDNSNLSSVLFRTFGKHPSVRALAMKCIRETDGPLEAIATNYVDDTEFTLALFDAAAPLPVELRAQVVEVAVIGASGTALENVLSDAMHETDPELRVRMNIAHYRSLPPQMHNAARQILLSDALATGPDYRLKRAAALAGLTMIDDLRALAALEENGKPVPLATSDLINGIATLDRLICEKFADFQAAFGGDLEERFQAIDPDRFAEILSAAPGASPAARTAFLALAERGEIPHTPNTLRALATQRPGSDLLLSRCWDTLDSKDQNNNTATINANVALILRDHFPGDTSVRKKLAERFQKAPCVETAISLAVFSPDAEELPFPNDLETLGYTFGDWAVAVHVAACRADSATFFNLLEAMVTRQSRSQFDAQQITNLAVAERLLRDSALEELLSAKITKDADSSINGSFARYLAAAGKLNPNVRSKVLELLEILGTNQRLPIGGYDAIADQWRAERATLLDAVSAELEIG